MRQAADYAKTVTMLTACACILCGTATTCWSATSSNISVISYEKTVRDSSKGVSRTISTTSIGDVPARLLQSIPEPRRVTTVTNATKGVTTVIESVGYLRKPKPVRGDDSLPTRECVVYLRQSDDGSVDRVTRSQSRSGRITEVIERVKGPTEVDDQQNSDSAAAPEVPEAEDPPRRPYASTPLPPRLKKGVEDKDRDNMPDAWEEEHGFDPGSADDARGDADADGYLNVFESVHGTDPRSAEEFPEPTIVVTNGGSLTIKQALEEAKKPYSIIAVSDGIYDLGSTPFSQLFIYDSTMLTSLSGPHKTVLHSAPDHMFMRLGTSPHTVLNGFKIRDTGGFDASKRHAVIQNCIFTSNVSSFGGSAIRCGGGALVVRNCVFVDNTDRLKPFGGVIGCKFDIGQPDYPLTVENCTISRNSARAQGGGGIHCEPGARLIIRNSIIWDNKPLNVGAEKENVAIFKSCIGGGQLYGAGVMTDAPQLYADGYHLTAKSPCIDAGASVAARDIDGDLRGHDDGVDIGVDEFVDGDGDLMPDWWELANGTDAGTKDGDDDNDGDDVPNYKEYLLAMDAGDAAQTLIRIEGTFSYTGGQTGGDVRIMARVKGKEGVTTASVQRASFSFGELPSPAECSLSAFIDINGNGRLDSTEPAGNVLQDQPLVSPLVFTSSTGGVTIVFSDPDADSDRMPDWWEMKIVRASGKRMIEKVEHVLPWQDFDGDGAVNEEELRLGSDPADPASTPPMFRFARARQDVSEADKVTAVDVHLYPPADACVSVELRRIQGNASFESDFVFPETSRIAFGPGETVKRLTLQILQDESREPEESVNLLLGDVRGPALIGPSNTFSVVIKDHARDMDGDGLPDWWERKYFGDEKTAIAGDDPDGDTWTNLQEYLRGGDPRDKHRVDTENLLGLTVRMPFRWRGGSVAGNWSSLRMSEDVGRRVTSPEPGAQSTPSSGVRTRTTRMAYDAQGRITSWDGEGMRTEFSYEDTPKESHVSATFNDGTKTSATFYKDGVLKKLEGDGVDGSVSQERGVENGVYFSKEIQVADGQTNWTKRYFGLGQRLTKVEQSGTKGVTTMYYDGSGRRIATVNESGVTNRVVYTAGKIVASGTDVDGDGKLTAGTADIFERYETIVHSNGRERVTLVPSITEPGQFVRLRSEWSAYNGVKSMRVDEFGTNTTERSTPVGFAHGNITSTRSSGLKTVRKLQRHMAVEEVEYDTDGKVAGVTRHGYDGRGRLTNTTRSVGERTDFELDQFGRVRAIRSSDVSRPYVGYERYKGGKVKSRTDADGSVTMFDYYPGGRLRREYGTHCYDKYFEYTGHHRKLRRVWRDGVQVDVNWIYSGRQLAEVRVAGDTFAAYAYRDKDALLYATKYGNGVTMTSDYDHLARPCRLTWSDGTPDLVTRYRKPGVTWNRQEEQGGIITTFYETPAGRLQRVDHRGEGIPGVSFHYWPADTHAGRARMCYTIGKSSNSVSYGYDSRIRVDSVRKADLIVDYAYNPHYLASRSITRPGAPRIEQRIGWDMRGAGRVTSVTWRVGDRVLQEYDYRYVPRAKRISSIGLSGGRRWRFDYDGFHHLASARLVSESDERIVPGMRFGYAYDSIGNTVRAGRIAPDGAPARTFTVSGLNMHASRRYGEMVDVSGRAVTSAVVTVNDLPCDRDVEWFHCRIPASAVAEGVTVNALGADGSAAVRRYDARPVCTGEWYIVHDGAGQLKSDEFRSYRFDGAGRLASVLTEGVDSRAVRVDYTYYPGGQRASKKVYRTNAGGEWMCDRMHVFVYDGWNLVWEKIAGRSSDGEVETVTRDYLWGLSGAGMKKGKLSAGSGASGGLVVIRERTRAGVRTYVPTCDAAGNIHSLIDLDSGEVAASYLYGPFGEPLGDSGDMIDSCPFRFMGKYFDRETGLYYFGKRYYDPLSTKWISYTVESLSREVNPNVFCRNDPVNGRSAIGL